MMISRERLGMLYVLVGPGGVGKNALLNEVVKSFDDLRQLPTATTRPMRETEQQGKEHLFVTLEEFQRMIENGELLEHQEVHPGQYYGVPRSTVERAIADQEDLIADIDLLGAAIIRENYSQNSVAIFIAPPTIAALTERLLKRGANETAIRDRLTRMPMEMLYAPQCRYLIVNDDMNVAVEELRNVIHAERGLLDPLTDRIVRNEVTFKVALRFQYADEILCDDLATYVEQVVQPGEKPNEVASRLIESVLPVRPLAAQLQYGFPGETVPLNCRYSRDDHTYLLCYHYTYHLTERVTPPQGWIWKHVGSVSA